MTCFQQSAKISSCQNFRPYSNMKLMFNIIICESASRNRTLARLGDFDFSPSAVSTTPSAPFYNVSELCGLA